MKSKKLISLLCATALAASSFVSLAVTAGAVDDNVLWSDTFDSYTNSIDHQTNTEKVGQVLVDGSSIAQNEYAGIEGVTLTTTGRADDSSYFKVTDDEGTGKALTTTVSRFSNASRGAQIKFAETYAPTADNDLVLAFKVNVVNDGGTTFDEAIQLNGDNTQEINFVDDLGVALDTWTDVKVVITTTGTSVYVGDSTTAAKTLTATSLSSIKFNGLVNGVDDDSSSGAQKAAAHPLGYPTISLDDAVVYTTAAGEGATAATPAAETKGEVEITYETVPVPEAPANLGLIASDNINDETTERLIYINTTEADSTYTGLDTVTLSCGTDTSTHSETKWSVVGNTKTDPALGVDKYLEAVSSVKSAANRGPKMTFKKGEILERETVVAQFATRLHASETSPAEVIFSGDLTASESKGNLSSPLAMITTDATAKSGVYACDNPLEQGGANVIEVPDNKWVLVTIEAYRSEGKTASAKISVTVDDETTYIFGDENTPAEMKDSTKSGINTLPYVSFRSGNSTDYYNEGSGSDTVNDIDNIAVYSSLSDAQPTATPEPLANVTTAFTDEATQTAVTLTSDIDTKATLIQAGYTADKVLSSVKILEEVTLTANTPLEKALVNPTKGDKIMVWNNTSKLTPLADVLEVTVGEEPATAAPTLAPTAEPTATATAAADDEATPTATAAAGEPTATAAAGEATPTATAAAGEPTATAAASEPTATAAASEPTATAAASEPTATAAPVYTVTGTVDAGVATVTLTADDETTYTGTIEGTAVTFTEVPAGTYTVSATAKTAYKNVQIDNATVTVEDDDVETAFAVTTELIPVPELTGTTLTASDFSDSTDVWGFVGNRTGSVVNSDGILKLLVSVNASSANQIDYKIFDTAVSASEDIEMIFDYLPQIDETKDRSSVLELSDGTDQTTVGNVILSLFAIGNGGVSYKVGATQSAITDGTKIASTGGASTALRVYIHFADGKVSGSIFDITGENPLLVAAIPETAVEATSLKRMAVTMVNSLATVAIDNVKVTTNDTGVNTITVTAPDAADGTLGVSQTVVRTGDVVTITATPATGKKLTAVKVNDTAIEAVDGAYTYTVTGEEEAIAVTAEFARANVTSVTVNGETTQIQKGQSATGYSATLKAGETEVTGDITWTVEGASSDDTKFVDGTLTIGADETAESVTLTATTRVDITVDSDDDNTISGTKVITVVSEPVYTITKAEATNGSFVVNDADGNEATTAKQNDVLTVVPTAEEGYEVASVSYNDGEDHIVAKDETNGYQITVGTANITVTVTFNLVNYNITKSEITGGTLTVKVGEDEATTATFGQTVTLTPAATDTEKDYFITVSAVDASNNAQQLSATDNGSYTFKMPASDVTVSVTFEETTELYKFDVSTLSTEDTNTVVHYAFASGEDATYSNVTDFGSATNTATDSAIPKLDGWGYIHGSNGGNDVSRQTQCGYNGAYNAIYAAGGGWTNVQPSVSFILANVDGITIPTSGKLIYTFTAYAIDAGGSTTSDCTFGFTSANDGATLSAVGTAAGVPLYSGENANRQKFEYGNKANMEFVYDIETGAYTLSKDGSIVSSGTNNTITGIYAQTVKAKYGLAAISNLVVKTTAQVSTD